MNFTELQSDKDSVGISINILQQYCGVLSRVEVSPSICKPLNGLKLLEVSDVSP